MRTLTAAAQTKISQQFAAEPINLIEVQWVADGPFSRYADRDIDDVPGRIIELSGLDFIIDVSDGSDSAEITVVLSDIEGTLKNLIDTNDVHLRDVWVYQLFEGLSLDDKILLFNGKINSPVTWDEGARTLSFTVISQIEDAEIGFSIEEGQFWGYDKRLVGKAWPLKFGTTINVPALRATEAQKGTLATGFGIPDPFLLNKINFAEALQCVSVFKGYAAAGLNAVQAEFQQEPSCVQNKCRQIGSLRLQQAQQSQYAFEQIKVIDGRRFPQNQEIELLIDGAVVRGVFGSPDENTFTVSQPPSGGSPFFNYVHPVLVPYIDECGFGNFSFACKVNNAIADSIAEAENRGQAQIDSGCPGGLVPGEGGVTTITQPIDPTRKGVRISEQTHADFNQQPLAGFFWAQAGTDVTIFTGSETVYISNILPEQVLRVAAYRQLDNQRRLITVPEEFYEVQTSDYGSYMVTEIVFERPMSQVDTSWEDDIFVTSVSSVGPNTVDIMEWLIDTYTTLSIDSTSFAVVRLALENYPMDFPYLDRRNVLDALRELAFQARCAIYVRGNKFFLKYLPTLVDSVSEFTLSDVDANSLSLQHTPTEDIVTKFVAEWQRDYSLEDPNITVIRHNVSKYGLHEEIFDFYAYNIVDYVIKSATFWTIRKANTWRTLEFSTPLQKLALETFDTVDLTLPVVNPGTIPGIIEQADFDSDSNTMNFRVWTPVRSGTTTPYDFAHPADLEAETAWPTDQEFEDGFVGSGPEAPGFSVLAPDGSPLAAPTATGSIEIDACPSGPGSDFFADSAFNNTRERGCGSDEGDNSPSDEDDEKVDQTTEDDQGGTSIDTGASIPPGDVYEDTNNMISEVGGPSQQDQNTQKINETQQTVMSARQVAENANEAAGGDGSGTANPDPGVQDLPSQEDLEEAGANEQDGSACLFFVNVFVNEATFVGGENGGSDPGDIGFIGVSAAIRRDRYTFATKSEAEAFTTGVIETFNQRQQAQDIAIGDQLPVNANHIAPLYNPPCDDTPDPANEGIPQPIGYDGLDFTEGTDFQDEQNFDYVGDAQQLAQDA